MFTIITPYVFKNEITDFKKQLPWGVPSLLEEDTSKIGPDMMYQKMWNSCETDVFIMHSDMGIHPEGDDWDEKILDYVDDFPEAGIFGLKLLYPHKLNGKEIIECAGGKFKDDGTPDHFGSGFEMYTQSVFKELEVDEGQYDSVREVAWYTFGGIYIRREVLDTVGNFDPMYRWSYNRDVDYCLEVRKAGWKIYQLPIPMYHFQSKDVKRIKTQENAEAEAFNLNLLKEKWKDSELLKTVDNIIEVDA